MPDVKTSQLIAYPKMKTLYRLQHDGNRWDCTDGQLLPETAPLHFFPIDELVVTEKIDGTNMAIIVTGRGDTREYVVGKRNKLADPGDKADRFYWEQFERLRPSLERIPMDYDIVLYGELCGPRINGGEGYFPERRFLLFDVFDLSRNRFFTWDALQWLAAEIGLQTVPELNYPYPDLSVKYVKPFVISLMSTFNPYFPAEGIVVRHRKDTSRENRYIAKIRRKDFRR